MKRCWFASALFLLLFPVLGLAADKTLLVADETSQAVQNAHADEDDLSRMEDLAMVRRFVKGGYLVAVPLSTSTYYLKNVPVPYRYARPWTKLFLTRLSRQFYKKFGHRLRVTSMVRTEERQLELADWNANAADATGPMRSSHLTGATVDISKRFMTAAERRWMRDVLYSLRESENLYAIEEFGQPTFHVMVYRSYEDYVDRLSGKARSRRTKRPALKRASFQPDEVAPDPAVQQ